MRNITSLAAMTDDEFDAYLADHEEQFERLLAIVLPSGVSGQDEALVTPDHRERANDNEGNGQ